MQGFNRPYVRNWNRKLTPLYVPGEDYSFYINFDDTPDYLLPGPFLELWVIKTDGTQVYKIGYLYFLYIAGYVGYNLFHPNFIFPYIPDGEYQFQVYDPTAGYEMCRSNIILCTSEAETIYRSSPVKFRHNDQLYGVRYDLLEDLSPWGFTAIPFYQKFRLPINQIHAPEFRSERQQYRQASGGRELRNSKSFRDTVITLEFYWADDRDHEAVSAILEHTDVQIAGNRLITMGQIKLEKPTEQSKLSKGTFEVIVDNYNIDYSSYEHYGDTIFIGGNTNVLFNTFVQG